MATAVLLLGAGGLARECWEILRVDPSVGSPLRGCFADPEPSSGEWSPAKVMEIGPINHVLESRDLLDSSTCVIAIGDIPARAFLAERIVHLGGALHTTMSSSVAIGSTCSIGGGSIVLALVTMTANVHVGRGTILNPHASLSHDVRVGDFCNLGPASTLCGHVTVGDHCEIGAGAVVLPKVSIGDGSIIGAGAVVTENVPAGRTVSGVPARLHP